MYQLSQPHPDLRPYIESYWLSCADPGQELDLRVEVFVDLRADLIFNFGAPYLRTIRAERARRIRASNLDAQRLVSITIEQRGDICVAGVRFFAGGLSMFVGESVHRWNDRVVPVAEVFGREVLALERSLRRVRTDRAGQAELFDAFFLRRLSPRHTKLTFFELKAAIDEQGGDTRVADLCDRAGISVRHMDRLFRSHLGYSPKTYARVVRFLRALDRLKADPGCTLAVLAADCDYYDQAHFVREFKAFAGQPPGARVGYFPKDGPGDFSPNVVRFVQDTDSNQADKSQRGGPP